MKRHRDQIALVKPRPQESKRHATVTVQNITMHLATIKQLVIDNRIDAARLWNLDEIGCTPRKDLRENIRKRRALRRDDTMDTQLADWSNTARTTLMAVVSASGDTGPPLFVFNGKNIPYRSVLINSVVVNETYASYLPRGAVMTMREKIAGFDTINFIHWSKNFVESVRNLLVGGRKILLVYDGYRAHMSLRVLKYFSLNGVIAYAIPSNTSGRTQPCDLVLFSSFKGELNKIVTTLVKPDGSIVFNQVDVCSMMRDAYYSSYTRENIEASFRRL